MLAPNTGMSHVDVFFLREVSEVIGRKKSTHDALRFITISNKL